MTKVFLSYSVKDYFFAELAEIKLAEHGIQLWRDQDQLRAGTDWRQGIEYGIADSVAVIVALSPNSADSSYVTYEWAYALGRGKSIVPLKIADCSMHPKLETIQHLTFTNRESLPWNALIERIREIERESEPDPLVTASTEAPSPADPDDSYVKAILAYLNQRGYQMASFDRLRRRIDESLDDKRFNEIIRRNPTVFRRATLKDGVPGLAKLVP
jgi:hypothetical protein